MEHVTLNWNLTSQINEIASTPSAWITKLEKMADAISRQFTSDAIWILTLPPLPTVAIGLMRTPRDPAPDAMVILSDTSPLIADTWQEGTSQLSRILQANEPVFDESLLNNFDEFGDELGQTFLTFFSLNIQGAVPLGLHDQASGLILLGNRPGKAFAGFEQRDQLLNLGQHLFLTLQNASLVDIANQQAKQLATLNRIARTITSSLDLDEVLARTILGIDEILDVEAGALLLTDLETNELYFKIILRGVERVQSDFRLKADEGIAGWVYQNQKPALVNDIKKDPRHSNRIDAETGFNTRSVLCVPLIVNGSAIGSLEVLNKRAGRFTIDDLHLLTSMTASLGIAVQNSTLFQQLQEQVRHMEQINSLTTDINARISVSETTTSIVGELEKFFTFEHAVLGLLDEHKMTIQHTILDKQGLVVDHIPPIPLGDSYFREVISSPNSCRRFDLTETVIGREQVNFEQNEITSIVSVLLRTEENEFGLFSLTNMADSDYTAENVRQLTRIAPTLSSALEKARLMDAMEQRTTELEELNLLSERLLTNTEPEFILDTVLKYIPRLLPAAIHGLILVDNDTTITGLRLPENASKPLIDYVCQEMTESLSNSLHSDQQPELAEVRSAYGNQAVPEGWLPQSKLAWPILTLRGALGVVYLAYSEESGITADRIRLFSLVVSRISGAIENSRLFTEVEQERARLAAILSSTADGILVVDQSNRVILDNPAANQILEHYASQRGRLLHDITDIDDLLILFERAEKSGSAAGEFTTIEDKTYYTMVSPVTVTPNIGKAVVIGWVAVMQDVTHFKELNETKDSFVNSVSHDLRSPLSGISLSTQLIQMTGDLNERQQNFIGTIQEHIEAMTKLIDDLLDVGKIEANIDMQMEAQAVSPILVKTVDTLRPQALQKQLELTFDFEDDMPFIQCNALRLQQVFSNLISNAIKYTPEGGRVAVNLAQQDEHLLFQVSDTGTGIPQADQPHIFEKFYRVRGEHMTGIKGTGLGLAITKSIVDKHNGKIWVDSKFKGGGSTFSVLLPVVNGQAG